VRKLLEDHQAGLQDNHKLLFSLVMLEQWMRGVNGASGPSASGPSASAPGAQSLGAIQSAVSV